jgi:lysine 2,3-aminomutase
MKERCRIRHHNKTVWRDEDEEPPDLGGACPASPVEGSEEQVFPPRGCQVLPFPRRSLQSPRIRAFRRRFFPEVSQKEWNDWRWQLGHRVRRLDQFQRFIELSDDEAAALLRGPERLGASVTPYYLSLIDPTDPMQPLRRTAIPTMAEALLGPGESDDPLGEAEQSPVPGLIHRYPDRVLLLLHDRCAMYCRYCTRSRVVSHGELRPDPDRLLRAVEYVRQTPSVRDVLLSGGDPLLLPDEGLGWILGQLRAIPHVEIVRIGTKVPAVLPQRVTSGLVRVLRRFHPLWMSLHFTHPDECTAESTAACERLADAGIPLGSQTVLLRGVNDRVDVMRALMHGLQRMRVRPYYLYQCDPIRGSAHFRTPVEHGLEILESMRGHTSGYAQPTFVVDAPGGGGKIPLAPDFVLGRDGDSLLLRNWAGSTYRYPDPLTRPGPSPATPFESGVTVIP